MDALFDAGKVKRNPVHGRVAAVSVGMLGSDAILDLDFVEDSSPIPT